MNAPTFFQFVSDTFNNTFVGALAAGAILALLALKIYRFQKTIDREEFESDSLKEAAAKVFGGVDSIVKNIHTVLNAYDENIHVAVQLRKVIEDKYGESPLTKIRGELHTTSAEISQLCDDFFSKHALYGRSNFDNKEFTNKLMTLVLVAAVVAIPKPISKQDLEEYRKITGDAHNKLSEILKRVFR